jgi:hypothetical protein
MHNLSSDIYSNHQFIYFHKAVLKVLLNKIDEILLSRPNLFLDTKLKFDNSIMVW